MYARSTTIQAQPSSIDDGIAFVRDTVMPALEGMDGFVGVSLLVDRQSGRCIATSAWESEEAMRASSEAVRSVREQATQAFGGTADVEGWEIAVLHRDHRSSEGACVRSTWVKVDPDQIDQGLELYRTTVLPALEELTRPQGDSLRDATTQQAGAEVLDECEFELALAHLRVPEMA